MRDGRRRLVEAVLAPGRRPPAAAIDFICSVVRRPTSPSTALKSARAATGCVSFHSPASFANRIVLAGVVTSSASTLSRSTFSTALSRRSNVLR